jgi:hypothetical protein
LSGIFTETGLPPAYEDEQLLAGKRVIANKPTGEPPDTTPPNQPANAPPPDIRDDGAWWEGKGEWQRRIERSAVGGDDEVLAMNAIAKHILALSAPDRAAIDEALADDETIDPYELLLDDGEANEADTRVSVPAQAIAVSVLLPFSAQAPRRRGNAVHRGRWPRRLERLQRG